MQQCCIQIKKIALGGALALTILSVWATNAYAVGPFAGPFPGPPKGECATGYTNIITIPADVTPNTLANEVDVTTRLPANVCMRWSFDSKLSKFNDNFQKSDFVVVTPSLTKADFNVDDYEPIIGHYTLAGRNYVASAEPRSDSYNDYTGKHPIFISKTAKASVRFIGGKYYIDKQTQIAGIIQAAKCPDGYSTVGESATCYSKKNGLKLNNAGKFELIELPGFTKLHQTQDCPLGYSTATGLGSNNGICISTVTLKTGTAKNELWNPWTIGNVSCKQGEYTENDLYCLPALTALYCTMDAAAQSKFTHYKYPLGNYVYYWPTKMVDINNSKIDFNTNASKATNGFIKVNSLRRGLEFFNYDTAFVTLSGLDGILPAFYLHSPQTCDKFQITGAKRIDPLPTYE
jgi:hypothetical protein